MIENETDEKVTALREELRNGRRTNKTSEGAERYSEGPDGQVGSSIQEVRRDDKATRGNRSASTGNKRSAKEIAQRVRSSGRRYGNDGSSPSDGNKPSERDSGRTVSAIERLDDVPVRIDNTIELPPPIVGKYREDYTKTERGGKYMYYLVADRSQVITPEEYKALPSEKDAKASSNAGGITEKLKDFGESIFPGGKGSTLTNAEARDLLEPLAAALIDYGGYLDKFLQMRTHSVDMPDIWGDMTEMEANVLARLMIRRGQKNAAAAEVVRNVVHGDDYIQAAIIVVPRVIKTAEALRSVPRKPKVVRVV